MPKRCEDAGGNSQTICERAVSFAQMGELSAARQALEGAQLAPGTLATLAALTNPDRSEEHIPVERFELDKELFLINLRTRGAVGPSGMTSDHLFPLLESERDSVMFAEFAQLLAVADVPHQVLRILGLGRLIALKKPDGGIRGIVVGDVLRRLVGRTMAKQVTKEVEAATSPFQYAVNKIGVRVRGTRAANPHRVGRGGDNRISGWNWGI